MAHAWHLKSRPIGRPDLENFELKQIALPSLEEGQIHVRNLWLSVDPYMRPRMNDNLRSYVPPYEVGAPLDGGAIGEVVESRAPGFAPGDLVKHMMGWRDEAVLLATQATQIQPIKDVPIDAYLGIMGGPGLTAYFGLFDVAAAEAGDTVFVSGAAGAVGSSVVQLAKARGLTLIASAGGASKCAWVRELGADAVIDYKAEGSLLDKLRAAAPQGIDVYFDNVGGEHLDAALATGKQHARFALCGMISEYNGDGPSTSLRHLTQAVTCRMTLRGFISSDYLHRKSESETYVGELLATAKIKWRSTVFEGLNSVPEAFLALFKGENKGKMLIKL
ncbi:NADP-dependent oxidoreductase [Rhizobium leguminosarum]|uniref:NADP-dependent oxidoreductase n=1 Tax=Rhizobium leguminosarum TaxID=384 RepID=UPI001C9206F2|nr:NADP-dependent oxidoreductase [Rhizobium leguminosarum]MBY2907703.1 NADP-dependent oxidoreductase [Rhizobium leguminosarum]